MAWGRAVGRGAGWVVTRGWGQLGWLRCGGWWPGEWVGLVVSAPGARAHPGAQVGPHMDLSGGRSRSVSERRYGSRRGRARPARRRRLPPPALAADRSHHPRGGTPSGRVPTGTEGCWRTDVVGSLPDRGAIVRLVGCWPRTTRRGWWRLQGGSLRIPQAVAPDREVAPGLPTPARGRRVTRWPFVPPLDRAWPRFGRVRSGSSWPGVTLAEGSGRPASGPSPGGWASGPQPRFHSPGIHGRV